MSTPAPTRAALLAVLGATAAAATTFVAVTDLERVEPRTAGWFLLLFACLFALRVAGQVVVALRRPRWLPPMEEWNLMPYRLLLPIQLVFLGVMAWLLSDFLAESGTLVEPSARFGRFVVVFAAVYAGAMLVRYVVRMRRRPEQRWFGGTIPIVFHLVLAAFLLVFGTYHASY
jgi:uncharacterized protein